MKKSEIYHLAQIAVLNAATIAPENKLEILRELMAKESYSKVCENLAEPDEEGK